MFEDRLHAHHGGVVLEIHDQLPVIVAGFANGPDKAIPRRGHAMAADHHFHFRKTEQVFGDLVQVVVNLVRVGAVGQDIFDINLVVVEVGKKGVLDVLHVQSGEEHQNRSRNDGRYFVVDEEGEGTPDYSIHLPFVGVAVFLAGFDFQEFAGKQGYLCKGQNPADKQGNAQYDKQIAGIGAGSVF